VMTLACPEKAAPCRFVLRVRWLGYLHWASPPP
jgi:hypothetical protein